MKTLKEWFRNLRYKIAYFIAPDWIDDLESRLSGFLWHQTGGLLSKSYYSVETMVAQANDWQQKVCDDCEHNCDNCRFYKEFIENADRRSKEKS